MISFSENERRIDRTWVSIIQFLTLPATCDRGNYFAGFRVSTLLSFGRAVEQLQSFFNRARLVTEAILPGANDADRFPAGDPLELVSRPNSVLVGDGFGDR